MATATYGTDHSTFLAGTGAPDLDPSFGIISTARVIAEAVARRWLSPRGTLVTDPGAGIDVRDLLGLAVDQASLYAIASLLAAEAERDDRVAVCSVSLAYAAASQSLRITARITPVDGSQAIPLVLDVSAVTTTILQPA